MKTQSFFRKMLSEKDLSDHIIQIEHQELLHIVEVEVLLQFIEQLPKEKQTEIEWTMRKIDFHNGDMKHYLKFLTLDYIKCTKNIYSTIQ